MARPKTKIEPRTVITPRIDTGILIQFDAMAKAKKLSRNDAIEISMRQWMNGGGRATMPAKKPALADVRKVLGYHPVTNEPIYEGAK